MPAQLAVLLALTAGLFDQVPLENMTAAQNAVHKAAMDLPAQLCARFDTSAELSDEDRKAVIEIAKMALVTFQASPPVETKS
jgi:F-type H+-transporting ATPase subunit alpha